MFDVWKIANLLYGRSFLTVADCVIYSGAVLAQANELITDDEYFKNTANKVKGVRAALCYKVDAAKYSRLHNDANVLVLGKKYVRKGLAKKILKVFLETDFEGGRHKKRVDKIKSIEDKM